MTIYAVGGSGAEGLFHPRHTFPFLPCRSGLRRSKAHWKAKMGLLAGYIQSGISTPSSRSFARAASRAARSASASVGAMRPSGSMRRSRAPSGTSQHASSSLHAPEHQHCIPRCSRLCSARPAAAPFRRASMADRSDHKRYTHEPPNLHIWPVSWRYPPATFLQN